MIALIAGAGDLPGLLAERLIAAGTPPVICAIRGVAPAVPRHLPHLAFRVETFGTLLADLRARGVDRICMAGAMQRPLIDPGAVDDATRPLIGTLVAAMAQGDNGTLTAIIALVEAAGFAVIGAEAIAPDLLPPAGVPTIATPAPETAAEAALGAATVAEMGRTDTGQACVIRAGRVIAREGVAGTDAMLAAIRPPAPPADDGDPFSAAMDWAGDLLGQAADWLSNAPAPQPPRAGILYKAPKPGQERRADLPVIGPDTVRAAAEAGLKGIVIAAGGVMVLHAARVVADCDDRGLFLWIRDQA